MQQSKEPLAEAKIYVRDIELHLWDRLGRPPASDDGVFYLHKGRAFLDRLVAVAERVCPKQMIEIGILDGGSTIFWQERFQLERLIAFDIQPSSAPLTRYFKRHGLDDVVRTHFGIA